MTIAPQSIPSLSRRSFLKGTTAAVGTGLAAMSLPRAAWAARAESSDAVRVAVIGVGNKGLQHAKLLAARTDVRLVALCDIDPQRVAEALQVPVIAELKPAPFTTTDARAILDRKDVDAVVIVTPNHWHALLAIWACQAGKDVYVEKPMAHTVWEATKMIEAAQKYGRVMQVGTQYRSEPGLKEGIAYVHSGALGKLKYVHAPCYFYRPAIGRRMPWYPTNLNYDVYCGPAPVDPLERDKLHYDFHWSWATGNGDLGNNGVHLLDVAIRFIGSEKTAPRVLGVGSRLGVNDAGETPNSQLAIFDYPEAPIIYEGRGLPAKPGVSFMDQAGGVRVGVVAHCEGGYVSGLVGCAAYDNAGKLIRKFAGDGGKSHMTNFLNAVRSRRKEDLLAPPQIAQTAAALCHHGNISLRIGRAAAPEQIEKSYGTLAAARTVSDSLKQHLAVHGIDLNQQHLGLGQWLEIDTATNGINAVESRDPAALARAHYLLRETQRPPYAIPEQV